MLSCCVFTLIQRVWLFAMFRYELKLIYFVIWENDKNNKTWAYKALFSSSCLLSLTIKSCVLNQKTTNTTTPLPQKKEVNYYLCAYTPSVYEIKLIKNNSFDTFHSYSVWGYIKLMPLLLSTWNGVLGTVR